MKDCEQLNFDPAPGRVAVIRALRGLGDLLCSVPTFRALRSAFPNAHIALIGLPNAKWFVERFHNYVDELIEFPGFPGIPERSPQIREFPRFLSAIQERPFDLLLQMQGNGLVMNEFAELLGARLTAGFFLPALYCPNPNTFRTYPSHEHEIWRNLRLLEFLGIPLSGDYLEFPLQAHDHAELEQLSAVRHLRSGEYVCIHPGSFNPLRRWAPANFAAVADALAERGLEIVLTGTREESALAEAVAAEMRSRVVNLAGETSLGALAVLLRRARLLLSNDTGVAHLAAALRVPSVIVVLTSLPDRWAPLDRRLHRVAAHPSYLAAVRHSQPALEEHCLRDACAALQPEGMEQLPLPTVDDVLANVDALLAGAAAPVALRQDIRPIAERRR